MKLRLNPSTLDLEKIVRNCVVIKKGFVEFRKSRPKPKGEDMYGPSYYVWRMTTWEVGIDRTMPWSATFYSDEGTKKAKMLLDYAVKAISEAFFEYNRPGDWMMGVTHVRLAEAEFDAWLEVLLHRAEEKATFFGVKEDLVKRARRGEELSDEEVQDWLVLGTDLGYIGDPKAAFENIKGAGKKKPEQGGLPGINPAFVKTARDERLWSEAKKVVSKEYSVKKGSSQYWALVNRIFHRMKHRVGGGEYAPGGNPAEVAKKQLAHYEEFHGTEPTQVIDMPRAWVPGQMVVVGPCVDIGYGIVDKKSNKEGRYVHDHESGVKVYARPDVVKGNGRPCSNPLSSNSGFPGQLTVLGSFLGFTVEENGEQVEYKGRRGELLCATPDRRKLVVVDKKGVLYVVKGGQMRVDDWIYK